MVWGVLLIGVSNPKDGFLVEVSSDNLQPHRQAVDKPAGNAYGWEAGEVDRHGEDVAGVEGEGILDFLPNPEWGDGHGGAYEDIIAFKGVLKLPLDDGSHFQRL